MHKFHKQNGMECIFEYLGLGDFDSATGRQREVDETRQDILCPTGRLKKSETCDTSLKDH